MESPRYMLDGLRSLVVLNRKKVATALGMDPKALSELKGEEGADRLVEGLDNMAKVNALEIPEMLSTMLGENVLEEYYKACINSKGSGSRSVVKLIAKAWKEGKYHEPNAEHKADSSGNGKIDSDRFYYFGFGSNLLKKRIQLNNPSAVFVGPALLKGYRLEFCWHSGRWNGGVATIVKDKKSDVWGALWTLEKADQRSLDDQEGVSFGLYTPLTVTVYLNGTKKVKTRTYQFTDKQEPKTRPSPEYLEVILKGAEQCNLPENYQEKLRAIEHNGNKVKVGIMDLLADD